MGFVEGAHVGRRTSIVQRECRQPALTVGLPCHPALSAANSHSPPRPPSPETQFGFCDKLEDCRYFWKDAEPRHVVDAPTDTSFVRAASIHRPRHRLACSSTASVHSAPAAQQPAAAAQEAASAASTAQLPGQGEAGAPASPAHDTLAIPFAVAAQQALGEEVANPVPAAAQPEAADVPNPLAALAEVDLGEDLSTAPHPAAAAKPGTGNVVSLVAVAAQAGCDDQGCQQAQEEPLYHTSTWWGSPLVSTLGRQRSLP